VRDEVGVPAEPQRQTDTRADLSPAAERRLNHLLYLRDWGDDPLTKEDERELEALTAPVARALIDGDISILAASKGISFAEARAGRGCSRGCGRLLVGPGRRSVAHGGRGSQDQDALTG